MYHDWYNNDDIDNKIHTLTCLIKMVKKWRTWVTSRLSNQHDTTQQKTTQHRVRCHNTKWHNTRQHKSYATIQDLIYQLQEYHGSHT